MGIRDERLGIGYEGLGMMGGGGVGFGDEGLGTRNKIFLVHDLGLGVEGWLLRIEGS